MYLSFEHFVLNLNNTEQLKTVLKTSCWHGVRAALQYDHDTHMLIAQAFLKPPNGRSQ